MSNTIFINLDFAKNAGSTPNTGVAQRLPSTHINPLFLKPPAIHMNPQFLQRKLAEMQQSRLQQPQQNIVHRPQILAEHTQPQAYRKSTGAATYCAGATMQSPVVPPLVSENATTANPMLRPKMKLVRTRLCPTTKIATRPIAAQPTVNISPKSSEGAKKYRIDRTKKRLLPCHGNTTVRWSRFVTKNGPASSVKYILQRKFASTTVPATPNTAVHSKLHAVSPAKTNSNENSPRSRLVSSASYLSHAKGFKLTRVSPQTRTVSGASYLSHAKGFKLTRVSPKSSKPTPALSKHRQVINRHTSKYAAITRTNTPKQRSLQTLMKNRVKSNVPCPIFQRIGKCKAQENGKCNKLHDKLRIAICSRFLRGECLNANCLLSHDISLSKMPVCKFFLQGSCGRDKCPYLHKKLSSKAPFCMDFLSGYCPRADKCDKRHEFLCPEFERSGVCKTPRCHYCAIKQFHEKRKLEREQKQVEKQIEWEKAKLEKEMAKKDKPILRRYFDPVDGKEDNSPPLYVSAVVRETADEELNDGGQVQPKRGKLGELPAFIPF